MPNPAAEGFAVEVTKDEAEQILQSDSQTAALYGLSMLHTLFNTINTFILIWFIPLIEKIVCTVSAGEISESTSNKIKAMYKIIGELESLGDSGESISRILARKNIHNKTFDADTIKKLNNMADHVIAAYDVMIENLMAAHDGKLDNISNAYNAEDRINNLRNNLRDAEIEDIENGNKNYQTSVYYMDLVSEFERMGDFMINVSQDLERVF